MIQYRDLVTWNAVLSAYVEQGHGETALVTYKEMLLDGEAPNQRTFVILLQACVLMAEKEETLLMNRQPAKVASLAIGQALHMDADKIGFMHDVFVGNSLISMYGKCGSILEAEVVFDRLSQRDVVSWNAIVSAYIDQGQVDKALRLYCRMCKQCITLVTLTRILQACSGSGSLEICRQLHFELVSTAHSDNTPVAPTLISAYGGCASMLDAQACCDEVPELDIASWNACIAGHAGEGDMILTFHVFETMVLAGVEVDKVTFVSLFSACAHCGLVGEGLEYFVAMNKDYGIVPDMKHYGSILNLLGRAGDFTRVESVLERMPMEADITLWLCLLGACTHGNLELAERAFENAVTLQPTHASPYVLMSNIYADAGMTESYVYSSL
jgi:pentatricopeptide repeat protein